MNGHDGAYNPCLRQSRRGWDGMRDGTARMPAQPAGNPNARGSISLTVSEQDV